MLRTSGAIATILLFAPALGARAAEPIRFNRDIRPILAENCFKCHGPDKKKRKAKLRLDVEDGGAYEKRKDGTPVVPKRPAQSELFRRITTPDPDELMPPPESDKTLTKGQIARIRAWIEQGAKWEAHWVFVPPVRGASPEANGPARSAIDRFVLRRLNAAKLRPSAEVDRRTLLRRLSFDLTGLPPTPAEGDAFLADTRPGAYERQVDRLLASPRFGERMAMYWLDLVRYADTMGYHSDNPHNVFMYREYVINAFNANKPYNQFTIEQLAGDLLPNATIEQKIASGYNRLLQTTAEGGAQPKEYMAIYAADRVRNVSGVWMGATMGCAQCHDHKFDPYTTRDFYSMAAFFADIKEKAVGKREAGLPVPSPELRQQIEELDAKIAEVTKVLETPTPALLAGQAEWEKSQTNRTAPDPSVWHSIGPFRAASGQAAFKKDFGPEKGVDLTRTYADGKRKWRKQPQWKDGKVHNLTGDNSATYLYRIVKVDRARPWNVSLGSDDTITVWLNGKKVLAKEVFRAVAPDQEKLTLELNAGENELLMKICNGGGGYAFYFNAKNSGLTPKIAAILKTPAPNRTDEQKAALTRHYLGVAPLLSPRRKQRAALQKQKQDIAKKKMPRTLVSVATTPRMTRILPRGNWLDDSGEQVQPAIPAFLGKLAVQNRRATRLDLARWLVSPDNPMTARAFANRLWKLFFGAGIAGDVGDLGTQGRWPSHPDLLDWLAVRFVDRGWDVKHLIRLMVTSRTYRQTSAAGADLRRRDPLNRLLARQSRYRLDAETIRDNALAVSGLLVEKLGGRSAKPYQPAGYWQHLNFPKRKYAADRNENQYRRGLYTYWQRSFLHPSLKAFDAPTREECTAERPRSNTPLQALVLLNDPTYVEAARAFAELILKEGGADRDARLAYAFRRALSRAPNSRERALLTAFHAEQRKRYAADVPAARQLLTVGLRKAPPADQAPALAAWTAVARVILNLHETITRN